MVSPTDRLIRSRDVFVRRRRGGVDAVKISSINEIYELTGLHARVFECIDGKTKLGSIETRLLREIEPADRELFSSDVRAIAHTLSSHGLVEPRRRKK